MREVTINIPNTDFPLFQRMVKGFGWDYTEIPSAPHEAKAKKERKHAVSDIPQGYVSEEEFSMAFEQKIRAAYANL